MERKKFIELIASLFIALLFISSYISLTKYNGANQTSTKSIPSQLLFASGVTNATIINYTNVLNIALVCNKTTVNSTSQALSNTLSKLESSNSILSFYSIGNRFVIESGSMNTTNLYKYVKNRFNATQNSCSNFTSTAVILLPQSMHMTVQTQSVIISIPSRYRQNTLPTILTQNLTNKIRVKVSTLLLNNGSIYGNLSIIRA